MRVVVGRLGRAHGLRGEATIEVRTDDPGQRFAPGAVVFPVPPASRGQRPAAPAAWPAQLTATAAHWHSGRLLVRFEELSDRTAVEALAGALLEADVDVLAPGGDPEEFHDLALVGLQVRDPQGVVLGRVREIAHLPAQDLLVIDTEPGRSGREGPGELLVPFVTDLVPVVDLGQGFLVVHLPPGLEPGMPGDA